ncbi:T-SNARE affecting a late Golgi compartment protein 2 [Scheffersomyces xylosifermentans]|uniref:T-SNARE affecting a late Golgi compartment protein 2 n=1 Tax=Scheffersomyces xylosifermentans TaxID=1304137 RepID=UPI00315D2401
MFRDRTNLFLSYRRTIPRTASVNTESRFDSLIEEEEGLIGTPTQRRKKSQYHDTEQGIEMKPLVPSLFDIAKELDSHLITIKRETNDLNALYKRLIIVTKSDKKSLETRIENLNYDILKTFEKCYILIKKYEYLSLNHGRLNLNYTENDLEILANFRKTYATKIQDSSLVFRNLQNNYIKFLRDDEDEIDSLITSRASMDTNTLLDEEEYKSKQDNGSQYVQSQQQMNKSSNQQYLHQREQEISKLAMGILEISTIFKEMETLVVDQGSLLDRIDYNLQNTVQDLKESDKELVKAKHYQKRTTKCKIIFLMSLIVFVLFILVLVKPHGSTTVVEKPSKPTEPTKEPAGDTPPPSNPDSRPEIEKPSIEKPGGDIDLNLL